MYILYNIYIKYIRMYNIKLLNFKKSFIFSFAFFSAYIFLNDENLPWSFSPTEREQ